jgi:hypothetical protein
VANVVAVQHKRVVATFVQGDVQCVGNRRFAGTAQAGKPKQAGFLVFVNRTLSASDFVIVPDNIISQNPSPY